jgi:hypothetical protein
MCTVCVVLLALYCWLCECLACTGCTVLLVSYCLHWSSEYPTSNLLCTNAPTTQPNSPSASITFSGLLHPTPHQPTSTAAAITSAARCHCGVHHCPWTVQVSKSAVLVAEAAVCPSALCCIADMATAAFCCQAASAHLKGAGACCCNARGCHTAADDGSTGCTSSTCSSSSSRRHQERWFAAASATTVCTTTTTAAAAAETAWDGASCRWELVWGTLVALRLPAIRPVRVLSLVDWDAGRIPATARADGWERCCTADRRSYCSSNGRRRHGCARCGDGQCFGVAARGTGWACHWGRPELQADAG